MEGMEIKDQPGSFGVTIRAKHNAAGCLAFSIGCLKLFSHQALGLQPCRDCQLPEGLCKIWVVYLIVKC